MSHLESWVSGKVEWRVLVLTLNTEMNLFLKQGCYKDDLDAIFKHCCGESRPADLYGEKNATTKELIAIGELLCSLGKKICESNGFWQPETRK